MMEYGSLGSPSLLHDPIEAPSLKAVR
jgi:hypothetical protein